MVGKPLTGRHVLLMIVGFFAVSITVNAVFITQAFRTFRGEDVPRSYLQGLSYNETLAARAAQADAGWSAITDVGPDHARIHIADANGLPVTGLELSGRLRHPADANRDVDLVFSENAPGHYSANFPAAAGSWHLIVMSDDDSSPPFEINRPLWLQ